MTKASVDKGKRRFLIGATTAVGGIGAVAAAVPFAMSFWPERAREGGGRAGRRRTSASSSPGQKIKVEWRGKVVWIINRTPAMLAEPAQARRSRRRSQVRRRSSAGVCQERGPLAQARNLRRGRHLHAPRLLADVPAGQSRRRTSVPTGSAAFSVRATSPSSILRAASTRACLRRPTSIIPPYRFLTDTGIVIGEDDSKTA